MADYFVVLINAIVAFIYLFIISKLLGKKQIAQMEFVDYVVGISLGSIAAEMAAQTDEPWYYYIIGMSVFVVLSLVVTYLGRKTPFLKKILKGKPVVIINNGKFDYYSLKKSKMDVNDVLALCRASGCFDIRDVKYAILETNGELSVLQKDECLPLSNKNAGVQQISKPLVQTLIVDGRICYDALKVVSKNEEWLRNRLNIKNTEEQKNILLAVYDLSENSFSVNYKNENIQKSDIL